MCFMESQGVDGHVGDDSFVSSTTISVQCSECQSGEKLETDPRIGGHMCSNLMWLKTSAGKRQERPYQCEFRSDIDVQIVRYIPLSLFPSSKANNWRNRQHVVLDLFSNLKCVRSSSYF